MTIPSHPASSFLTLHLSAEARKDRDPAVVPAAKEQHQDDTTKCHRHPDQRVIGLCASCLRERLLELQNSSRRKPSFFSALKSAVICKTATSATTSNFTTPRLEEQGSCDDEEEEVMMDIIYDLEPGVEKPPKPREPTHNSFWLAAAASALNKKLQNWKRKRMLKKINRSSSTTVDAIERQSSGNFGPESVLPARLQPVLTTGEDTKHSPAVSYWPKEDVTIPGAGGDEDTRDYYSDSYSTSELSELIKKRYCSETLESAWNFMYQGGSSSTGGGGGSGNNAEITFE